MYPCQSGNFERHLRPNKARNKGAQFATKSGEIDVLSRDFKKMVVHFGHKNHNKVAKANFFDFDEKF